MMQAELHGQSPPAMHSRGASVQRTQRNKLTCPVIPQNISPTGVSYRGRHKRLPKEGSSSAGKGRAHARTHTCEGFEALQGVQGPDFDGVVVGPREQLLVRDGQRQHRPRVVLQHLRLQQALLKILAP